MACPLLENDFRRCKSQFSYLVEDVSLNYCKSEEYSICPLYKIIEEKKPYCEYIEECGYNLHRLNSIIHHNKNTYKKIMHLIFQYCLSENKAKCARYKSIKDGEPLPRYILQDGNRIKTQDLLTGSTYH
jgi:hypothetical protein